MPAAGWFTRNAFIRLRISRSSYCSFDIWSPIPAQCPRFTLQASAAIDRTSICEHLIITTQLQIITNVGQTLLFGQHWTDPYFYGTISKSAKHVFEFGQH